MPSCDFRYGGGLTRILMFLIAATSLLIYEMTNLVPAFLGFLGVPE